MSVVRADKGELEQCLENGLKTWVKADELNLNVQKTQLLVLSRRREQETMEIQIEFDGKRLERSMVVECLRGMLDNKLQWNKQVQVVKRKACAG